VRVVIERASEIKVLRVNRAVDLISRATGTQYPVVYVVTQPMHPDYILITALFDRAVLSKRERGDREFAVACQACRSQMPIEFRPTDLALFGMDVFDSAFEARNMCARLHLLLLLVATFLVVEV
jgi:hypothetical protein